MALSFDVADISSTTGFPSTDAALYFLPSVVSFVRYLYEQGIFIDSEQPWQPAVDFYHTLCRVAAEVEGGPEPTYADKQAYGFSDTKTVLDGILEKGFQLVGASSVSEARRLPAIIAGFFRQVGGELHFDHGCPESKVEDALDRLFINDDNKSACLGFQVLCRLSPKKFKQFAKLFEDEVNLTNPTRMEDVATALEPFKKRADQCQRYYGVGVSPFQDTVIPPKEDRFLAP